MTLFIFAGDMVVMLFMVSVVTWLFFKTDDEKIRHEAEIPLHDDFPNRDNKR